MNCSDNRLYVWTSFVASVCCDIALIWQLITDITVPGIFVLLFVTIGWAMVTVVCGFRYPFVTLLDEGVYIRRFFYTKKYEWQDFIQVGITHKCKSHFRILYGDKVFMLLPGAVKYNPKEDFIGGNITSFLLRNAFFMFMIPIEEGALSIIQKNYGDLDFEVTMYGSWYKN